MGGGKWISSCPAHKDPGPSLTVTKGRKGTLLYCFAGCETRDVCAALDISMQSLFFDASQRAGNHDAHLLLRQMQGTRRNYEAWTLRCVHDVAHELWSDRLSPDAFLRAQLCWPDEVYQPFDMANRYLITNGYLGDLWADWIDRGELRWMDMATRHRMYDKMVVCWHEKGLIDVE